jgi:hypothetical protein
MRIIKLEMEEEEHRTAVDEVFRSPSAKHPSKVVQSNNEKAEHEKNNISTGTLF